MTHKYIDCHKWVYNYNNSSSTIIFLLLNYICPPAQLIYLSHFIIVMNSLFFGGGLFPLKTFQKLHQLSKTKPTLIKSLSLISIPNNDSSSKEKNHIKDYARKHDIRIKYTSKQHIINQPLIHSLKQLKQSIKFQR